MSVSDAVKQSLRKPANGDTPKTSAKGSTSDFQGSTQPTLPPHSKNAEESVLGACLMSSQTAVRVAGLLTDPAMFYLERHRTLWKAILGMVERKESVDLVSVGEELRRVGELSKTTGPSLLSLAWLAGLVSASPIGARAEQHAKIVWENGMRRKLIAAARDIATLAADEHGDIFEDLDGARAKITGLMEAGGFPNVSQRDEVMERAEVLADVFEQIFDDSHAEIIPTGFHRLDRAIGGLRRGECIDIAGRPGSGKTAFATSMAMNIAGLGASRSANPRPVLILEIEMGRHQIWSRVISPLARIELHRFFDPQNVWSRQEAADIAQAIGDIGNSSLYIDTQPVWTLPAMRRRIEKLIVAKQISAVIVDHAGKIRMPRGHSKHAEFGDVAQELKAMAKEYDIPMIPLWQLNRACDSRNPPRPVQSDLRESGTIEEEADLILMTYRPEHYRLTEFEDGEPATNMGDIMVEKNRNGAPDICRLAYVKRFARWENPMYV